VGVENSAKLVAANNDTAIDHARAAVNAADLGFSIIGELETLIRTIYALASSGEPTQDDARQQLGVIRNISRLASHFASERSEDYEFVRGDLVEALATLRGAA
jgi:hypothetical protein